MGQTITITITMIIIINYKNSGEEVSTTVEKDVERQGAISSSSDELTHTGWQEGHCNCIRCCVIFKSQAFCHHVMVLNR